MNCTNDLCTNDLCRNDLKKGTQKMKYYLMTVQFLLIDEVKLFMMAMMQIRKATPQPSKTIKNAGNLLKLHSDQNRQEKLFGNTIV